MKIIIRTQPHEHMRYDTLGDWQYADDLAIISVSEDVKTADEQFLIALHELVESYLCSHRDITQDHVDKWDFGYEAQGLEPGDHPEAPYRREHRFAMLIEHLMAHELGIQGYGRVE